MTRLVVLTVLLVGVCLRADAAVLCIPKSGVGKLAIRTQSCKKNEQQLDPAVLGLQGPPGAVAKDANGNTLGLVNGPSVLRAIGDAVVAFHVSTIGFEQELTLY